MNHFNDPEYTLNNIVSHGDEEMLLHPEDTLSGLDTARAGAETEALASSGRPGGSEGEPPKKKKKQKRQLETRPMSKVASLPGSEQDEEADAASRKAAKKAKQRQALKEMRARLAVIPGEESGSEAEIAREAAKDAQREWVPPPHPDTVCTDATALIPAVKRKTKKTYMGSSDTNSDDEAPRLHAAQATKSAKHLDTEVNKLRPSLAEPARARVQKSLLSLEAAALRWLLTGISDLMVVTPFCFAGTKYEGDALAIASADKRDRLVRTERCVGSPMTWGDDDMEALTYYVCMKYTWQTGNHVPNKASLVPLLTAKDLLYQFDPYAITESEQGPSCPQVATFGAVVWASCVAALIRHEGRDTQAVRPMCKAFYDVIDDCQVPAYTGKYCPFDRYEFLRRAGPVVDSMEPRDWLRDSAMKMASYEIIKGLPQAIVDQVMDWEGGVHLALARKIVEMMHSVYYANGIALKQGSFPFLGC